MNFSSCQSYVTNKYTSLLYRLEQNKCIEKILQGFNKLGLFPVIGIELEFYLTQSINVDDVVNILQVGVKKERGEMQYEALIEHSQDVFKCIYSIKTLMRNMKRSFANKVLLSAKPKKLDYGNSMQFNVSIYNSDGLNYFDKKHNIESACFHICKNMLETFWIFCKAKEELERFDHKFMAPVNVSFSQNNRTSAIRIPTSPPKRIEHRLSNPMTCPHLALFVILKCIYISIVSDKIEACSINTYKVFGNAFDKQYNLPSFPSSVSKALDMFNPRFFETCEHF